MKNKGLFASFLLLSLVGIGCTQTIPPKSKPSFEVKQLPPMVDELQKQEVPSATKQPSHKVADDTVLTSTTAYQGSWFTINYPSTLIANPTGPTDVYKGTITIKTDEATFTSPDGTIEFYVYSPLWGGKPTYAAVYETEELVDQKEVQTPGDGFDKALTEWVTVKAKDNSYYRSYVHVRKQIDTGSEYTYTFGIKYKDADAYNTYKDAYIAFKKSLVQFAD